MGILNNIRRRLSVTLSLWVLLFIIVAFGVVLFFFYSFSQTAIKNEAMEKAEKTLDCTLLRVEKILDEVVIAERNVRWLVLRHLSTPDSMFTYSKEVLKNNPNVIGCSIAFEPYYFSNIEKWFSAYSYNVGDTILTEQEGTERYDYYTLEWYKKPNQLGKPYWIDPFREVDTGGIEVSEIITSYCTPLYLDKKFIGVLSIDVSLEWLSEHISSTKPYPNSYSLMIDTSGRFIVHPDSTLVFYGTIFDDNSIDLDTRMKMGRRMIAGDSGYMSYEKDGKTYFIFFKPLGTTGWSVAMVCPESDVLGNYNRILMQIAFITFAGLFLLIILCLVVLGRKPAS